MPADRTSRDVSVRRLLDSTRLAAPIAIGPCASLALIELGTPAFVAAGVAAAMLGDTAPWFVAGAVLIGFALRAIDLESCALFVPGGLYGSVKQAFGAAAVPPAAAVLLLEYLAFAALAASAAGHTVAALVHSLPAQPESTASFTVSDIASTAAVGL